MIKNIGSTGAFCAWATACVLVPSVTFSQSATDATNEPPATGGLEEIVVTAQKRSENLQNVPIAVSVLTATELSREGINGITDLRVSVPTLNLQNSSGYLSTSLRGFGTNALGPGIENPVALYIDGVYYASPAASLLSLNNVEQIEVLKGPQGTLFGRNATGGLIQITTRDPTQQLSGDANISYGNYQTASGNAYLAGGITDTLRADIAVEGTHQGDGYGTNSVNGDQVYQVQRDLAVRSKIVFEPVSSTKFTAIGDYSDHVDSMDAYTVFPGTTSGFVPPPSAHPFGPAPSTGYDVANDVQPLIHVQAEGASLRWDQSLSDLQFMSLTAYRKSQMHLRFDYDGSEYQIGKVDLFQPDNQLSEELQLSSANSGRLTWLTGAYYFRANAAYDPSLVDAGTPPIQITSVGHQRTVSYAGYAQGTYEIADNTKFTLGGRYTTEERYEHDGSTDVLVIPTGMTETAIADDQSKKFDKFTFRVSLDHRFSDSMFSYVSWNRGFQSGGFNTNTPSAPAFDPETLDAYEIGIKSDLLDRRVRINAALFDYEIKDVQVQKLDQGTIDIYNGAKARDYGLDTDVVVLVTDALRLSGALGLFSPKFTSFPNCLSSNPRGGTPSTIGACDGNLLPLAARTVANLGTDYNLPIGTGTLDLNANVYYNSGYYPESDNVIRQPSYENVGASATYTSVGGLSVGLYGKNLNDARVINYLSTVPVGTHDVFYRAPRTYGLTVGYKF